MCSESSGTAGLSSDWRSTMSCHQTSRPSCIAVPPSSASPSRRTTSVCSIVGVVSRASSTAGLSAAGLPRRQPPSAVMTSLASASLMRSWSASALNPPKITVCGAPRRAQASIAIGSSGIIGM